jgi:hypothetical protein
MHYKLKILGSNILAPYVGLKSTSMTATYINEDEMLYVVSASLENGWTDLASFFFMFVIA